MPNDGTLLSMLPFLPTDIKPFPNPSLINRNSASKLVPNLPPQDVPLD